MKRRSRATLVILLLSAALTYTAESARIPMNPLNPISMYGHTNAFLLQNRQVEAVLFPTLGRVGLLNFRGEPNLLRFDSALAGQSAQAPAEPREWRNFGGDWMWPVSQARWPDHFHGSWPPPWVLDGPAWSAHGWINSDQSQTVVLEIELGDPVNITVQREFTLPVDAATLIIRQRITRNADSSVPVTLWNISQLAAIERIAMATETNSSFVGGYRVLDFTPPAASLLNQETPSVLVVDVRAADEIKIGTDSPRNWIAAQRGDTVVIERATGNPAATVFPDGGCRTELYSNSGLGYSEIETLSEEVTLFPGQSVENTLTVSLYRVPADLSAGAFATRIHELLGEHVAPRADVGE